MDFKKTLIKTPSIDGLRKTIQSYQIMLLSVLDLMIARYEAHPDYHFIDMKLSTITGNDFEKPKQKDKDYKGKSAVMGWIQGRGLESLVGHSKWVLGLPFLSEHEKAKRYQKLHRMTEKILQNMERIRKRNNGRIPFLMTPEGVPNDIDETGNRIEIDISNRANSVSDIFYGKGLMAAAHFLGKSRKVNEAITYYKGIIEDIEANRLVFDQISFDPKNRVRPQPGINGHGSRMLTLGACALLYHLMGEKKWLDHGVQFIDHTLARHVNKNRFAGLKEFDFFEFVHDDGKPWKENGKILSDPGHSLEFIGLACKVLLASDNDKLKSKYQDIFVDVFLQNFGNGFNRKVGGICKAFDLMSREPINGDMPWWSLPETMRAAAELLCLYPNADKAELVLRALCSCSNAFMSKFVNPKAHLMAYQTLNNRGRPVNVVPATPDADPGYHTGLSIIDLLYCLKQLQD